MGRRKILLCAAFLSFLFVGTSELTSANIMLFWGGDPIPSGWECVSDDYTEPFYQRFPRGAPTYGGQGGSETHSHGAKVDDGGLLGGTVEVTAGHTHSYSVVFFFALHHTFLCTEV